MKVYVKGFAESQKSIENELSSHTKEVIEHMLKCYLMPDHMAVNHWKSEIAGQMYKVDKLKSTKKYPSENKIYEWTYESATNPIKNYDSFSRIIHKICDDYSIELLEPIRHIYVEFDNICSEYFTWLSNELSRYGSLTSTKIYEKLDDLIIYRT